MAKQSKPAIPVAVLAVIRNPRGGWRLLLLLLRNAGSAALNLAAMLRSGVASMAAFRNVVTAATLLALSQFSYAAQGFFQQPAQEGVPQSSLFAKSAHSFGYDGQGRVVSITGADGTVVRLLRDFAGRVVETHSPTQHTTWHYADGGTIPIGYVRDGVAYSITQTSAHGVLVRKMAKGTLSADGAVDPVASINGASSYFDACAANPSCGGRDFQWVWSDFWSWAGAGGISGGATGFWVAYGLDVSPAIMADWIAIFGAVGASGAGAFYGGYQFGTWIYNNYGEYWWIRLAP